MSKKKTVQLNDSGTPFEVTITDSNTGKAVNIQSATSKKIIFKKPNGDIIEKTAVFLTDGADGIIVYVSVPGDIDQLKVWSIQAEVTTPTGFYSSTIDTFEVMPNLKPAA